MKNFVVLFHGQTFQEAQVVSVSVDAKLARRVAKAMLAVDFNDDDDVLTPLNEGRREALKRVAHSGLRASKKATSVPTLHAQKGGESSHDADSSA